MAAQLTLNFLSWYRKWSRWWALLILILALSSHDRNIWIVVPRNWKEVTLLTSTPLMERLESGLEILLKSTAVLCFLRYFLIISLSKNGFGGRSGMHLSNLHFMHVLQLLLNWTFGSNLNFHTVNWCPLCSLVAASSYGVCKVSVYFPLCNITWMLSPYL